MTLADFTASYAVLEFPEPHIVIMSLTAPPMNQVSRGRFWTDFKGEYSWSRRSGEGGQLVRQ